MTQPWNPFSISSTSQPFKIGTGVQNTSPVFQFGNPPVSNSLPNFTPTSMK